MSYLSWSNSLVFLVIVGHTFSYNTLTFKSSPGVFLAFLFPAMLQYYSVKRVKDEVSEDLPTPYTTWYSTTPFVIIVFLFGLAALALMLTVTINPEIFG